MGVDRGEPRQLKLTNIVCVSSTNAAVRAAGFGIAKSAAR
jgi:hypothetical protein